MKIKDKRINNNKSAKWYITLVNEYLKKINREINGGWLMTSKKFETYSYRKDVSEKHIIIIIYFEKQEIELTYV